ncbi:V/A-type H+-transporting ATPase subunit D [Sedimentibacter acidaminivorans]|uniref:V-type ATP synthase subunit D n=1 Tax=Sedimentibacter acidaminivorans TaxID=913099 RepID=A0ABS4GGA6_9FIRM|nr:V-type ATP synthase subunit D [Sedimentibacter acidaminivorans]MBP1926415.1 V/A-type H+-transporting ATPase subunit D [Sedimentibacter acidaminivorans]
MARLNVNPTRMVLTSLKKRLKVAVKGHKMLKDKRDELMRQFLELARENKTLREQVEKQLADVYSNFIIASAVMSSEVLDEALMYPKQGVSIEVGNKNIMSVDVPVFEFTTTTDDTSNIYPYGFASTSGELDSAIADLSDIFPIMLKLAALEKEVQLLAAEIEKTRRRVNALEYVMIPRFQETIKYIQMKLDENERGNQTRLMKVKDMMLAEAIKLKKEQDRIAFEEYK